MALSMGHVNWTATRLLPDGTDVGTAPDVAAVAASVTFFRPNGYIVDATGPSTVFVKPMTFAVDAAGVLRDGQGAVGVDLPAGPWRVVFNVQGFTLPESSFTVTAGQTVNLTTATPVTPSTGGSTTGLRGESAYEVAVRNGFVGTEVQWLASLGGGGGGGTSVVDNGDGTFVLSGTSVTDNGDGTFVAA